MKSGKHKPYDQMNAAELAEATKEYDELSPQTKGEILADGIEPGRVVVDAVHAAFARWYM